MPTLFIVDLTYQVPLESVEPHMAEHMRFLECGYADGLFIASGRKVPRTGGVILARAASREALEAFLENDPFKRHGIAAVVVTEMVPGRWAPELNGLFAA